MGNNIEKNKISGNNTQIIGGDQNNITNVTNYTYVESTEHTTYRKVFYLNQIKNSGKFVKVSQFEKTITQLKKQNAIMLVGCSGIGKTSFSFIISNYFMQNQNYNFRFATAPKDNDFDNILNTISENKDEKEIVIIDDFLGNLTLNLSESAIIELEQFLKDVDNFENKKFIFTTRKTILRQLITNCKSISLLIKHRLFKVDLDNYNESDKLNIFKYYCQKNKILENVQSLCKENIWKDKAIKAIIEHANFTPLIIDFATKECIIESREQYLTVILKSLENPDGIWEKEINALDTNSHKYMYILLSLSNSSNINCTISDECFEKYMQTKEGNIDYAIGKIHSNLEALIKLDANYLSFVHPSLIEYLDKNITEQTRADIINSAIYLEQIEKMDNTKDTRYVRKLMEVYENKLPKIFNLKVMPLFFEFAGHKSEYINIILTHYLKYLYKFKITDDNHQRIVIDVLKKILEYNNYMLTFHSTDIISIFNLGYDFSEILNNESNLQVLFSYANSSNIWCLLSKSFNRNEYGYDYSKLPDFVKESLLEILREICVEQLEICDIEQYVDEELENYDQEETFDYDDVIDAVKERIHDDLDFSSVTNIAKDVLKKHLIYNFDEMEEINDDDNTLEKFWEYNLIEDEITEILDNL